MAFKVGLDAAAVEILAKLRAEHVQDPATLVISQVAEHVIRRIVSAADDGMDVVADAGNEAIVAIEIVKHRVATVLVTVIKRRVIGGEAFVEPKMAPVLAGDQIAKPLVGHLVRNQTLAAADIFRVFAIKRAIGQCGSGGVFHSAGNKIVYTDLIVLWPGIGHAD